MKWKELTKIGITGSRRFPNTDLVTQYLDKLIRKRFKDREEVVLITGGAIGVDCAVETYCRRMGIKNLVIPARWIELEKVAGPRRNGHIVDLSSELIAFWSKKSPGTGDCIERGKARGIPVTILTPKKLRLELGHPQPLIIKAPKKIRKFKQQTFMELLKEAEMDELFKENR